MPWSLQAVYISTLKGRASHITYHIMHCRVEGALQSGGCTAEWRVHCRVEGALQSGGCTAEWRVYCRVEGVLQSGGCISIT